MAIQDITTELNIVPGGIIPVVHVSQYDIGRVLKFPLLDGTSSASIPEGTTADIEGTKPSNKGFAYSATIASNVVTVSTTDQMTVEEGDVYCKIKLTKDTQIIGTALFIMEVERAGINDSTDISETDIPAFIELGRQNMLNSEAWAVGTKGGEAVESTEPQYHNNSKYYSDLAGPAAETATIEAAIAKSWASYSNDANIYGNNTNNAHYWSDQAASKYNDMIAAVGTALNKINSFEALMELLFGEIYMTTESGDRLLTESGDNIIIDY